ncbi:peroxisomal membrane protein 11C-like [Lineus longissimus]|uniref:peroxisomal membrane protein 11C-like n=1 Tax=Lineus longissimus TaxID=88925 RepID=UPI002B4DC780
MPLLDDISQFLCTWQGRDKTIRTCSFGLGFISGVFPTQQQKLGAIQGQLSSCRVVLRLFGDLPVWLHCVDYGLGAKEKHPLMKVLGVINNVFDLLYFPIEHIAWLGDLRVVDVNSSKWWRLGIITWGLSLWTGIVRSLLMIYSMRLVRAKLIKQKKYGALDGSEENMNRHLAELIHKERIEVLLLVQRISDLLNAIHWMPEGFLWAQKLSKTWSGLFGLISSSVMVYSAWINQQAAKTKST